jgi:hypothetical protein
MVKRGCQPAASQVRDEGRMLELFEFRVAFVRLELMFGLRSGILLFDEDDLHCRVGGRAKGLFLWVPKFSLALSTLQLF